jgi:phytoene/squalene synthetase
MRSDYDERGRVYFPGVDFQRFDDATKSAIEADIAADFDYAYTGIVRLPEGARFGVYLAYKYYRKLFDKITMMSASTVQGRRIRVSDSRKIALLVTSAARVQISRVGYNFL